MKKTISIIIANAPINNGNRGCVALSISSMYIIDEILTKVGVKYKLYLPDSQHGDCMSYKISINGREIEYYNVHYNKGLSFKDNVKIGIKNIILNKKLNKVFKEADFILR